MILYILAAWGLLLTMLLLIILRPWEAKEKRNNEFALQEEIKNVFLKAGLVNIPDFHIAGYVDLTSVQLNSEYVTVDFREPINASVIQQTLSLNGEYKKYWKDLGNGFFHYNKEINYGTQSISFTICEGATRILMCHFMS